MIERCGCLSVVTNTKDVAQKVSSQLCRLVRAQYSNPPAFGARIVSKILNDPVLYEEWYCIINKGSTIENNGKSYY